MRKIQESRRKSSSLQAFFLSKRKAVIINGVEYSYTTEAGKALGVHSSTINYRIKAGWPGYSWKEKGIPNAA